MNKELPFYYDLIQKDYVPSFEEDDDRLFGAKECVQALSKMEKRILLTYVELQTYAASAREFHVSAPTFKNYLNGILAKVRGCCAE